MLDLDGGSLLLCLAPASVDEAEAVGGALNLTEVSCTDARSEVPF